MLGEDGLWRRIQRKAGFNHFRWKRDLTLSRAPAAKNIARVEGSGVTVVLTISIEPGEAAKLRFAPAASAKPVTGNEDSVTGMTPACHCDSPSDPVQVSLRNRSSVLNNLAILERSRLTLGALRFSQ